AQRGEARAGADAGGPGRRGAGGRVRDARASPGCDGPPRAGAGDTRPPPERPASRGLGARLVRRSAFCAVPARGTRRPRTRRRPPRGRVARAARPPSGHGRPRALRDRRDRSVAAGDRPRARVPRSGVSAVIAVLLVISVAIFAFFVVYTLTTLSLTAYSLFEEVQQKIERGDRFRPPRRPLRSGISLVVPAYNEEVVIVPAVRSLLGVDYEPLEVVVAADGPADGTFAVLNPASAPRGLPPGHRFGLDPEPLEALYVSAADPRLHVARKRNGG